MAKTLEVFFEPVDNARLAKLCGVLDENLRQIENAFDITVSRRGEHFTLAGHPAQVLRGEMALKHFYALADKDLSRDEVQLGLIEIASKGEAAQPAPVLPIVLADEPASGSIRLHLPNGLQLQIHVASAQLPSLIRTLMAC